MVAAAAFVAGIVVSRLRLVLLPLTIGLLLSTALVPPARWMVGRGLRPLLATWVTILGFLAAIGGLGLVIVPPLADQFGELGPTLEDAVDDVEDWLVDGPLGLDPQTLRDLREDITSSGEQAVTADGALVDGAVLAGELVAGAVLTLVVTFFFVKDGSVIQAWGLRRIPTRHRDRVRHMCAAAWSTLGRYLLGAATLGLTEAVIIGTTMALTGGSIVFPVAVLTFVAAFFPFVGALVAGVIAVLVTLVSSGVQAAVVVAVVAVLVQQFDNEILAPFIYSRALKLHPLVVILSVATGAAVAGFLGAFLAVPLAAVAINAAGALGQDVENDRPEEERDGTDRDRGEAAPPA